MVVVVEEEEEEKALNPRRAWVVDDGGSF